MAVDHPYDRSPCGLLTIDGKGRIVDSNQTFQDWFAPEDREIGVLPSLLRTGDRIYWETHVRPILDIQGRIGEIALEVRGKDGPLPVLLNARKRHGTDLIDVAVFPAVERRSYERELLAARNEAEESRRVARRLAETLQQSLIPPSLPEIEGLEMGAAYRPAGAGDVVGGDFYDVFQLSPTEWLIVVGDVCGKGAAAASLTAKIRFMIRGVAMETTDLSQLLDHVNQGLVRDRAADTCTALLIRIDTGGEGPPSLVVCAAGHPLPVMVTTDGDVSPVGKPGTLLGAFDDAEQTPVPVKWAPGDTLLLYTDGITEARRGDEFYSDEQFYQDLAKLRDRSPEHLASSIVRSSISFQGGLARDDAAAVVLRPSSR